MDKIVIKNATLHNLKGIDVEIPKNKFVCVTGVSGSGKTSAMLDILYEESRRRYMDISGISTDYGNSEGFERIEGLIPVIAVKQENNDSNPRSSVGTRTGIYDMLRWVFFLDGKYLCGRCGSYVENSEKCSCGKSFPKKDIGLLSYNSPAGMCDNCSGNGIVTDIDFDSILSLNPDISIVDFYTAVGLKMGVKRSFIPPVRHFCKSYGLDIDSKYLEMDEEAKNDFILGVDNSRIRFPGIEHMVRNWMRRGKTNKGFARNELCRVCKGLKLSEAALHLMIGDFNIGDLSNMSVSELKNKLKYLMDIKVFSEPSMNICGNIFRKIESMEKLGLGYLSLFRIMPTLSGGESQRLSLMTQLDMKMNGVAYVFDEPTHGLHQIEKQLLLDKLEKLRDLGNSVIVIEHDSNTIERSEYLLDFGPGAGKHGGEITFAGNTGEFLDNSNGKFASKALELVPHHVLKGNKKKDAITENKYIKLTGVKTNNLKNIDVTFPVGKIIGIAGVSGSGKTSLISKTLYPLLKNMLSVDEPDDGENGDVDFTETGCLSSGKLEIPECCVFSVFITEQKPIGKNSKSTPATYLGVLKEIQKEFAALAEASSKGFKASDFSYNSKGACKTCGGKGYVETWMIDNFFSREICPECGGRRYDAEVDKIKYGGYSVSDILKKDFEEIAVIFSGNTRIMKICGVLADMGIGYLEAGQPLNTLSGGEAQRMKLAKNLIGSSQKNCVYIFDEPSIGLSNYDVGNFMKIIYKLALKNTVIIIEHDTRILSSCDWLVEIGPGAGENGGCVIAQGTVEDLSCDENSIIGRFLKK